MPLLADCLSTPFPRYYKLVWIWKTKYFGLVWILSIHLQNLIVSQDTFFDAEDGSARNLKMSLLNAERGRISSHDWLQFDSKNQEFYGIPTSDDIGRKEYQLVVTDHEGTLFISLTFPNVQLLIHLLISLHTGLSATDALVVVVHSAPDTRYSIEFQMTLDIPFESLEYSAAQKRNLVEKLQRVFGDRDSSSISLHRIHKGGPGSTVVTWRNVTLPTDYCPNEQVDKLLKVLFEVKKKMIIYYNFYAKKVGTKFF